MDKLSEINLDDKIASMDTPESAPESEAVKETAEAEKTPEAQALLDLSKAEKFLFKGKEMTLTDLEKAMLRQEDYTRKTQALAEERKYYDNLTIDLDAVKRNPALASEFKKVYPEKFHRYLDVLGVQAQKEEARQGQVELPREVLERIDRIEGSFMEKEKEAFNAKLESIEQGLQKKFPYANLTDVYGSAQTFFEQNQIDPKKVDEKMLEPFFEASHKYNTSLFQAWQKEQLKQAKEANEKASDIGRGGGTPGQAPRKYSRLTDVADDIIASEGL